MIERFKYPLLLFGPDNTLEVISSKDQLTITNKLGLKHGIVLNNTLVDEDGNCYKTIRASKLRNKNPFWKFEFFNPMIEIRLEAEKSGVIELQLLKDKIIKIVQKEISFWSFKNRDQAKLEINSAVSMKELFLLLRKRY